MTENVTAEQQLIKLQQREHELLKQYYVEMRKLKIGRETITKIEAALQEVQASLLGASVGKVYQSELSQQVDSSSPRSDKTN